jgi:hypothetical protein
VDTKRYAAAFDSYNAAWAEKDEKLRLALIEEAWEEGGTYLASNTPDPLVGRQALSDLIGTALAGAPGLAIVTTKELQFLGDRGWMRWGAKDGRAAGGTDFIEFGPEGRIQRLTNFFDE